MKVTAIIDDKTIKDAMTYSRSSTITDALKVALNEYIRLQRLKELNRIIRNQPLTFNHTADEIRNLNRER